MTVDTFYAKFDELADSPNAVARLRSLVLKLAVQGRLVDQCRDDQPAAALAEEIREQRAAYLTANGLARKRIIAPLGEDQCPPAHPDGWVWTRMGNLCRVQAGFAFQSDAFVQVETGVPLIRIRDITNDRTQVNYVGEYRAEFIVETGDYLVGMDGNFTVAKWRGPRALLNQRVSRLQWYASDLEPSFFAIALQHRLTELQGTKAYTTVDHLSSGQIENAIVPLPPLAEQKRIVAKVDELMALCDRLEAQQQEREARHAGLARAAVARVVGEGTGRDFELLFHSSLRIGPSDLRELILTLAVQGGLVPQHHSETLARTFLDRDQRYLAQQCSGSWSTTVRGPMESGWDSVPFSIPVSWAWARLEMVADKITDGEHLSPVKTADGMRLLTATHVTAKGVMLEGSQFVSIADGLRARQRCDPRRGDILICSRGTIGRCAVVETDEIFCLMGSVILVRVPPECCPKYFYYYFSTDLAQSEMRGMSGATAVQALYLRDLRQALIPIPPLAEQRRIVAKVDHLMSLVDQLEVQLAASRTTAANLLDAVVAELTARS